MSDPSLALTAHEQEIIAQQLGREPLGIMAIVAKSGDIPLVLRMRSWLHDAPFPTLFWLCSKDLHTAINKIETAGFVKQLEAEIADNPSLKQAVLADQAHYVQLRENYMLAEDKASIEKAALSDTFATFGIGGIKHWDKVRCLHMHYAFHLALKEQGGSAIGRILDARFALEKTVIQR